MQALEALTKALVASCKSGIDLPENGTVMARASEKRDGLWNSRPYLYTPFECLDHHNYYYIQPRLIHRSVPKPHVSKRFEQHDKISFW